MNNRQSCLLVSSIALGLGACAVIAFFVLIGKISHNAISQTATQEESAQNKEPEKAVKIAAKKLYSIYSKNEVLADAVFKDHLVSVSGKAGRVSKTLFNQSYLQFDTETSGVATILCYFDESQLEGLVSIVSGKPVEVTGHCTGKTFTIVTLQHCSIEPTVRK